MARAKRLLPTGCSFHITLRCNSRQCLIAKALRRDVLLVVLKKAQQKFAVRVYGLCLMAKHLHLLLKPSEERETTLLLLYVFVIIFSIIRYN
ncbi:Transposase IS200 like protein [Prochlorococcus marinus str. MIT 1313]|uniref:transposase n=1 Tax=Prochlorococcus TaxID=1218 RepID=UPI0007BBAE81|nr:Transposase IS200 like protein [Prochlorococcus marinus str. MIT 1313]KZR71117.1 Transposase IS200 like protein [Prochlorococcus marinus str. MIT 1318]